MLDAFYVNDQPEFKFTNNFEGNQSKKSTTQVSSDYSNTKKVDIVQEFKIEAADSKVVTDVLKTTESTYQVDVSKNNEDGNNNFE